MNISNVRKGRAQGRLKYQNMEYGKSRWHFKNQIHYKNKMWNLSQSSKFMLYTNTMCGRNFGMYHGGVDAADLGEYRLKSTQQVAIKAKRLDIRIKGIRASWQEFFCQFFGIEVLTNWRLSKMIKSHFYVLRVNGWRWDCASSLVEPVISLDLTLLRHLPMSVTCCVFGIQIVVGGPGVFGWRLVCGALFGKWEFGNFSSGKASFGKGLFYLGKAFKMPKVPQTATLIAKTEKLAKTVLERIQRLELLDSARG